MIGIKTLEEIRALLQSDLNQTQWKEMSGGSDYSYHKDKVQKCIDAIDKEIKALKDKEDLYKRCGAAMDKYHKIKDLRNEIEGCHLEANFINFKKDLSNITK